MRRMIVFLLIAGMSWGVAGAGELDPPGPPAPTMRSLQEIYDEVQALKAKTGGGRAAAIFPHVIEGNTRTSSAQYAWDTSLMFVFASPYQFDFKGAQPEDKGGSIAVEIYFYNQNGDPVKSATNADVANPAVVTLSFINRKHTVVLHDLIEAAGGFASPIQLGYVVVYLAGGTWNDVVLTGFIYNSKTSALDLAVTSLTPSFIPLLPLPEVKQEAGPEAAAKE